MNVRFFWLLAKSLLMITRNETVSTKGSLQCVRFPKVFCPYKLLVVYWLHSFSFSKEKGPEKLGTEWEG